MIDGPWSEAAAGLGLLEQGLYIEGNIVHLCPDACAAGKGDLSASLEIRHCVAPG